MKTSDYLDGFGETIPISKWSQGVAIIPTIPKKTQFIETSINNGRWCIIFIQICICCENVNVGIDCEFYDEIKDIVDDTSA